MQMFYLAQLGKKFKYILYIANKTILMERNVVNFTMPSYITFFADADINPKINKKDKQGSDSTTESGSSPSSTSSSSRRRKRCTIL